MIAYWNGKCKYDKGVFDTKQTFTIIRPSDNYYLFYYEICIQKQPVCYALYIQAIDNFKWMWLVFNSFLCLPAVIVFSTSPPFIIITLWWQLSTTTHVFIQNILDAGLYWYGCISFTLQRGLWRDHKSDLASLQYNINKWNSIKYRCFFLFKRLVQLGCFYYNCHNCTKKRLTLPNYLTVNTKLNVSLKDCEYFMNMMTKQKRYT